MEQIHFSELPLTCCSQFLSLCSRLYWSSTSWKATFHFRCCLSRNRWVNPRCSRVFTSLGLGPLVLHLLPRLLPQLQLGVGERGRAPVGDPLRCFLTWGRRREVVTHHGASQITHAAFHRAAAEAERSAPRWAAANRPRPENTPAGYLHRGFKNHEGSRADTL